MEDFKQSLTENSYSRQEELSFWDCDRTRHARVAALLSRVASLAGYDYDARGLPYEKLYEMREVFLLSRVALRIHRCPAVRERITSTTWEDGAKGAHMQRTFEIRDQAGEVCVASRSDWILVDPLTRKILRPASFTARQIQCCPVEIDCPYPKKILLPREGLEPRGEFQVRWSDLDGNGHLFSGNYGDVIWNALPEDLQVRIPQTFQINYSREATLGETLQLVGFREGETYRMEGVGSRGVCFTALCEF